MKRKPLTPEEFVRLWQTSPTLADFCEKTGMKRRTASLRAAIYRRRGVPLKPFPRGLATIDAPALARLAQELSPKEPRP